VAALQDATACDNRCMGFLVEEQAFTVREGQRVEHARWPKNLTCTGDPMMKLDTSNRRDWQGFTRILEVMSFLDELENQCHEDVQETIEGFCELPANPSQSMSMEEVVFWAGVASGMEYAKQAEEGNVDEATADKMLVFSSIFSHSMKNAIVDLALGDLENNGGENKRPWLRRGTQIEF
jgi:hypothetical protein